MFGHTVAAPLGVAAGPHTQLAQNIVASWLCGARFIELKTVQILDEIEVSRPCIDSADETYNCEWSQELKLEESFREYLNAWVLLHALAHRMGLQGPGTHFNMSVGYNLEGIQNPRVQAFIAAHARRRRGPARGHRPGGQGLPGGARHRHPRPNCPTTSPSPPCTAARRRRSSGSPATCSPTWACTPG